MRTLGFFFKVHLRGLDAKRIIRQNEKYGKYHSKGIACIEACKGSPSDSTMRTCKMEPIQPGSFASGTRRNHILTWDRAIHQGNLPLHVEALSSVQLVFRLLEHYHCTLALSVYLRDIPHLKSTHPSVCLQSSAREINSM